MKKWFLRVIVSVGLVIAVHTQAEEIQQVLSSGEQRGQLIELYTSEGCSSCPPADRWLSTLVNHDGLWRSLVPVAFHVDYWNDLGWRDPFSRSTYSQRQRRYRSEKRISAVYTPGFIINGREWRTGYGRRTLPKVHTAQAGRLQLTLTANAIEAITGHDDAIAKPMLNVALLGMGITSKIARGENHGRTLEHNFVVLDFSRFPMEKDAGPVYRVNTPFQLKEKIDPWQSTGKRSRQRAFSAPQSYGIAAWVSPDDRLSPIQVLGGELNSSFWR